MMKNEINLLQQIEKVRLQLLKAAKETQNLNHEQVLTYSVILDELIIKFQRGSAVI